MNSLSYAVMDPTGNVTILVKTPVPAAAQPETAARLLAAVPAGEQVGFLSVGDGEADLSLRMAGGEFCGNAAMSAAAYFCTERGLAEKTVAVRVSGASEPVSVQAARQPDGSYACALALPRPAPPETVALALDGATFCLPLLRFEGIFHLILPGDTGRAFAERAVRVWCARLDAPALGLMLLDEDGIAGGGKQSQIRSVCGKEDCLKETQEGCLSGSIDVPNTVDRLSTVFGRMTPLVYVPGGDTLYWERSCASGTAAAGAYLAWKNGGRASAALAQPGGVLHVSASPVGPVTLRGTVRLLNVGELSPE